MQSRLEYLPKLINSPSSGASERCDSWVDRISPAFDAPFSNLAAYIQSRLETLPGDWSYTKNQLGFALAFPICHATVV